VSKDKPVVLGYASIPLVREAWDRYRTLDHLLIIISIAARMNFHTLQARVTLDALASDIHWDRTSDWLQNGSTRSNPSAGSSTRHRGAGVRTGSRSSRSRPPRTLRAPRASRIRPAAARNTRQTLRIRPFKKRPPPSSSHHPLHRRLRATRRRVRASLTPKP
jgi:hypothetical protein